MNLHPSILITLWADGAGRSRACVHALADAAARHLAGWGDGDNDAYQDARSRLEMCRKWAGRRATDTAMLAEVHAQREWPVLPRWAVGHGVDPTRALTWGPAAQVTETAADGALGCYADMSVRVAAAFDLCRQLGDSWVTVFTVALGAQWADPRRVRAGAHLAAAGLADSMDRLARNTSRVAELDDASLEVACGLCAGWEGSVEELAVASQVLATSS